jgi:hypothetical protein
LRASAPIRLRRPSLVPSEHVVGPVPGFRSPWRCGCVGEPGLGARPVCQVLTSRGSAGGAGELRWPSLHIGAGARPRSASALPVATSRAPPVAYKCPAIASARWPPHGAGGGDGGVLESRRGRRVALRDLARGTSSPACPSVRAGVPDLPPLLGRRRLVSATERQELLHVPVVPPVGDPAVAVELRHTGDGDRQEPLTARVVGRALRGKLDAG